MNRIILFSLGFLLLLSSCGKDDPITQITPPDVTVVIDEVGVLENYEPTVTPVTGSVDGFITDENGDAIPTATVKLGNLTTTTNLDGHFDFLNVEMNKAGTIIQVIHPGYFDGSRRFNPTGTGVDRVRIQLLQKVFDQSVDGATGGAISIPGANGTIDFPANSIVDANGDTYTGTVDIAVKYLDPTAEITSQQMPGDLFGVTQDLEEQILASYGMIAVELVDVNGNPLNLGEGTPATVTAPVPANLLGNAPATIPLWSYNEAFGVWAEEGEATLVNGKYVGEVTHFSWWNFDVPGNYQDLTITLVDQNGNPLANHILKLTSTTFGTAYGTTNSIGESSGQVPAGEVIDLSVTLPNCVGALHNQNIGPFPNPTNTITITATISPSQTTTITGNLDCNGTAINDGVMKIDVDGEIEYFYGINTNFSKTLTTCTPGIPFTVKLLDPASGQESIPYTGTTGTTNSLGTVDACQNNLSEFLLLNLDGTSHLLLSVVDSSGVSGVGTSTFNAYSPIPNGSLRVIVTFEGDTPGSYAGQNSVYVRKIENGMTTLWGSDIMTNFDVTTHNSVEMIGSFSGVVQEHVSNTPITISGSFDVDK